MEKDKALAALTQLERISPAYKQWPEVYHKLVNVYYQLLRVGDYSRSEHANLDAEAEAHYRLGLEQLKKEDFRSAVEQLAGISPQAKEYKKSQSLLARIYVELGNQEHQSARWQEAAKWWGKAHAISPSLTETLHWRIREAKVRSWLKDYKQKTALIGLLVMISAFVLTAWHPWDGDESATTTPPTTPTVKVTPTPNRTPITTIETTTTAWAPIPTSTSTQTATPAPTPTSKPTSTVTLTPTPTPIPPVYSDEFDSLDENVWETWANAEVNLVVRDGALHAERGRTETQGWGDTAGIRLKGQLDFAGVGTTITWRATLNRNSYWNLMYARVLDRDADRVLYFDCGTGAYQSSHSCTVKLHTLNGEEIWGWNRTASVTEGRWHVFTMVNPTPQEVRFYIDGALLKSHTFSDSEWNGMDWVTPEWIVAGWDGHYNLIDASLDSYSHGRR